MIDWQISPKSGQDARATYKDFKFVGQASCLTRISNTFVSQSGTAVTDNPKTCFKKYEFSLQVKRSFFGIFAFVM